MLKLHIIALKYIHDLLNIYLLVLNKIFLIFVGRQIINILFFLFQLNPKTMIEIAEYSLQRICVNGSSANAGITLLKDRNKVVSLKSIQILFHSLNQRYVE